MLKIGKYHSLPHTVSLGMTCTFENVQCSHIVMVTITLDIFSLEVAQSDWSYLDWQKTKFKCWCPIFRGDDYDTDHYVVAAEVKDCWYIQEQCKRFDNETHNVKNVSQRKITV